MRRLPFLIAAALLTIVGCKKPQPPGQQPKVETPQSALVAQPRAQENRALLDAAAHQPGAQRFHVSSARGAGDLVVQVEQPGDGPSPKPTDTVKVHYRGTLADGTEFDSSYKRGEPVSFPLDRVVPCWTEALQHMKVGEKAKITCSPETAYGAEGAPPAIPANAVLTFEVELLGVNR